MYTLYYNGQITLEKFNSDTLFANAKLELMKIELDSTNNYSFNFKTSNFRLGEKTNNPFQLAASKKGQHIHFIINNNPYSAHYSPVVNKKLAESNNVILAFLARSFHESVKNNDAFYAARISNNKNQLIQTKIEDAVLFYSRPKGTYSLEDSKKILLDFYIVNEQLLPDYNINVSIDNQTFNVDTWSPFVIEGLKPGTHKIKIEITNQHGEKIDMPFNPSERTFVVTD